MIGLSIYRYNGLSTNIPFFNPSKKSAQRYWHSCFIATFVSMKPLFFFVCLFFGFATALPGQFTDNFTDGDFSSNPTWIGNTDRFIVNEEGMLQLQDTAPASSNTSYLATAVATSLNDDTTWEFFVRLEFSPSASNFASVYLLASRADLTGDLNGYFVKIGGISGNDDAIELYRQDGNRSELLISGMPGGAGGAQVVARVRVTRSESGTWQLAVDYSGGEAFVVEGEATDNTYDQGRFLGVYCRYTSTRGNAFLFDDFFADPLFVDADPPVLLSAEALSATEVEVIFDEPLDAETAQNPENFRIDNGIGTPRSAILVSPATVFLELDNPLASTIVHTLTADGIADVSDNAAGRQTVEFVFFDLQLIEPGDVVINEVLFFPEVGGKDFIELYNVSGKVFDLRQLTITNTSRTTGNTTQPIQSEFLLLPGAYAAITDDPQDIQSRYAVPDPDALLENRLPTLDQRSGNVTILRDTVVIDAFDYSDELHFPLLSDRRGVSLERISPTAATPSPASWQSAAEAVGFATPGYQNSQFFERSQMIDDVVQLPNKTFSPDGDGFEDVLLIEYQADQPNLAMSLRIFDAQGRLVKRLVENELLAARGSFKWDGTNAEGAKARVGVYVLWIELFAPDGRTEVRKETCVLAGKL